MSSLEKVESLAKILALVIGAAWAVWNFNWRRARAPKVHLEHEFYTRPLGDSVRLVTVTLAIHNRGNGLFACERGETRLHQVFPLRLPPEILTALKSGAVTRAGAPIHEGETVVPWHPFQTHKFRHVEVEPGESDCIAFDFVVPSDVETVRAYTFIANRSKQKQNIGWKLYSMHDIDRQKEDDR